MIRDYLIVSKKILPKYFSQVIEARTLLESSQCKSVSEAVKRVGISRSTYYKYKDYIFNPSEDFGRKFTLSMILDDQPGVLSNVLNILREHRTSIITIHQDIPLNHAAVVILTLDGKELSGAVEDLISALKIVDGVHNVHLVAME